jgi:predicted transcriptional regulator
VRNLGVPTQEIARMWLVSPTTVRRYLRGECKHHRVAA